MKSKALRDLRHKRKKMEQAQLGKINTLTEKNDMHKMGGLHRVKIQNLIQNEHWVRCQPRVKSGAPAETVRKDKTVH
jgi:hypothetical protein